MVWSKESQMIWDSPAATASSTLTSQKQEFNSVIAYFPSSRLLFSPRLVPSYCCLFVRNSSDKTLMQKWIAKINSVPDEFFARAWADVTIGSSSSSSNNAVLYLLLMPNTSIPSLWRRNPFIGASFNVGCRGKELHNQVKALRERKTAFFVSETCPHTELQIEASRTLQLFISPNNVSSPIALTWMLQDSSRL